MKKIVLAAAAAALCLAALAGLVSLPGNVYLQELCAKDLSFAELTENGQITLFQTPEELARLRCALKSLRAVRTSACTLDTQQAARVRLILHTSDGGRSVLTLPAFAAGGECYAVRSAAPALSTLLRTG